MAAQLCPACGGTTSPHATALALGRHQATYLRCDACRAVFVHEPTWLEEAYAEAINDEDVGLLARCASMSRRTAAVLRAEGVAGGRFLDWGGGYGTFARMMRDRGFAYFHSDPYCDNLFARDIVDEPGTRYDLVTAFEVLEHLTDPVEELAATLARTDRFLASTFLVADPAPAVEDWWYYGPEHGQHVFLHTEASLRAIGARHGFQVTSNGVNLHLFHREPLRPATRLMFSQAARTARVRVLGLLRRR